MTNTFLETSEKTEVTKRDGSKEKFNANKINKVLEWATEGIKNVSASEIAIHAKINIFNGISSSDIHNLLISSASDLISEEFPNYSKVAARLLNYKLRKDVWKGKNPPKLFSLVKENVDKKHYWPLLLEKYSEKDFHKVDEFINHDRDDIFEYAGYRQLVDKYLVQDRGTGILLETPQFAYALISMILFCDEKENRIEYVRQAYNAFSEHEINLATPIMAGARTPTTSYSSCCLIEVDDDRNSLFASNSAAGLATCDKYGIGLDLSKIRAINSPIRNGETLHTGVIPWLKVFESTIHSCQQGGARRGAATVTFPIFHYEIEDILQLKENTGTEDNRVRHLDYSISVSRIFWERYLKDDFITLFSSHETMEVYDAFGQPEFDNIYEKYEKKHLKFKKKVKARDLFNILFTQRVETGRYYILNIDQCNLYSSWCKPIRMSNLCVSGSQRVVSDRGNLTAKELFEQGGELRLFDNKNIVSASEMKLIEKNVPVYKIELDNGMTHTVTSYHKILTSSRGSGNREIEEVKECKNLKIGDRVAVQTNKGLFGSLEKSKEAFLLGLYQSDGTQHKDVIMLDVWENDFDLLEEIQDSFNKIHYEYGCDKIKCFGNGVREIPPAKFHECDTGQSNVRKMRLSSKTLKKALNFEKGYIPSWIWEANEDTHWQYVRGLLYADGDIFMSPSNGEPIQLKYTETNKEFLKEVQILFANLGLQTSIRKIKDAGLQSLPDGKGGNKEYFCKTAWRLIIGNKNDTKIVEEKTGFLTRKGIKLEDKQYRDNTKKYYKINSIKELEKEDVYCCSVKTDEHLWICNGVVTHNCQEVLHTLEPFYGLNDKRGEIGVCILSAVNMLKIKNDKHHERICNLIVRMLDNLIDTQTYFDESAKRFADKKRSLGIGITNLAGWLASKGENHCSERAPELINEFFEKQQYFLLKASNNLAKERGRCERYEDTKYSQGLMPLDFYNENVDEFLTKSFFKNEEWENLKKEIEIHGLRNCTLSCQMPCEASSLVQGSTNGMEPIRSLITFKTSKTGSLPVLAPHLSRWKHKYVKAFDMPNNDGMIKVMAAINKWLDMSSSFNLYSSKGSISMGTVAKDILTATKYGAKSFYYHNTDDEDVQNVFESGCTSGSCTL